MATNTANLNLPLIEEGVANERIIHNLAISFLDALTGNSIISKDTLATPVSPSEGDVYVIDGVGTSGDFVGQDNNIAIFLGGIWNFISPVKGNFFFVRDIDERTEFDGAAWGPFTTVIEGLLTTYSESGQSQSVNRSGTSSGSNGTTSASHTIILPTASEDYLIFGEFTQSVTTTSALTTNIASGTSRLIVNGSNYQTISKTPPNEVTLDGEKGGAFSVIMQDGQVLTCNATVNNVGAGVNADVSSSFNVIASQILTT